MSIKSIQKAMREARKNGEDRITNFATGEYNFFWCCDCNLRHILRYEVIRGKRPCDDVVRVETIPDFLATDLKRFYDSQKKKRKK